MPGFGQGGPWSGPDGHPFVIAPTHPGWAPFVWGLLPAIVFGGLIALIVYLFVRTSRLQGWPTGGPATATPVGAVAVDAGVVDAAFVEARMRYARGELDREEYLRIARDLGHGQLAGPPAPEPPATD